MKVLLVSIDLILGTRILVNVLKNENFSVQNLQITGIKYSDSFSEEKLRKLYEFSRDFDVVGLSFNSFYSLLAEQLAVYLRSKGIRWIICGGPHATAMPEDVIKYSDVAVVYEAELTLPKVLNSLRGDSLLGQVKGIVFKDSEGRTVCTGCPEVENNLDNIPFQNFSAEDITYYNFSRDDFEKPSIDTLSPYKGRNYLMVTSRGCPFNCTYCCNNLFAKLNRDFMKVRKRSIENVISEMEAAKKLGWRGFQIADDNFLAFSLKEIEIFSDIYKQRINLPFGIAGVNPNNMRTKDSVKKIDLLLSCGLSDARIGVQSGSNKTLAAFNRKYTAEEVPELLTIFNQRKTIWPKPNDKLRIAVDFICDAPWEDEEDKEATLKLANNLLSTYGIFFYTLIYLPGTDIYDTALEKGWIQDKKRDIYLRGIAGVEDNIYNKLLFAIAVLKERGAKIPEGLIAHILKLYKQNPALSENIVNCLIGTVNRVEEHHCFEAEHMTLHPYLKGFNKWKKEAGRKGKAVLFRSYHEPYG